MLTHSTTVATEERKMKMKQNLLKVILRPLQKLFRNVHSSINIVEKYKLTKNSKLPRENIGEILASKIFYYYYYQAVIA